MKTSYLKAHPLWNRYPEWTPNFHSDRSRYSNPCAGGSQGQAPERKRFHCTTVLVGQHCSLTPNTSHRVSLALQQHHHRSTPNTTTRSTPHHSATLYHRDWCLLPARCFTALSRNLTRIDISDLILFYLIYFVIMWGVSSLQLWGEKMLSVFLSSTSKATGDTDNNLQDSLANFNSKQHLLVDNNNNNNNIIHLSNASPESSWTRPSLNHTYKKCRELGCSIRQESRRLN